MWGEQESTHVKMVKDGVGRHRGRQPNIGKQGGGRGLAIYTVVQKLR